MTERERWIVYPLLFLALGAALRDKLIDTTMSRRIVCQELVVVDGGRGPEGPQPVAQIGAVQPASAGRPALGQIVVNGRVEAQDYLVGGRSIAPRARQSTPVISLQDLFRLWQQSSEAAQQRSTGTKPGQPTVPQPQQAPPATDTPAEARRPNEPSLPGQQGQPPVESSQPTEE